MLGSLWGFVWLLVVKGNLSHRIELLGVEKPEQALTEPQRRLRIAAREQGFDAEPPERPSWANGAFVYLTQEHAADIQQGIRESGVKLLSKHILVSGEFKDALKAALDAKPDGSGREAYQIRRAGEIFQEERVAFAWLLFYLRAAVQEAERCARQ